MVTTRYVALHNSFCEHSHSNRPLQIRVFGDPEDKSQTVPVMQIALRVWPSPPSHLEYFRTTDHDILPTFVDGYAFGQAIGVGLQAISDWWTVSRVEMDPTLVLSEVTSLSVITLIFMHNSNLSPSHTVY